MAAYRTVPHGGASRQDIVREMKQPVLVKRALSDILESGAILALRHLLPFLRATALLIPVNAILVGLSVWFTRSSEPTALVVALIVVFGIVDFLVFVLTTGACLNIAADVYSGSRASVRKAVAAVIERFGSFVSLVVVLLVAIAPGLAFLIALPSTKALGRYAFLVVILVPVSLWLAGIWSVALPAMLVEQLGVEESLRRSRTLVAGRFLRSLGTVVFGTILALFADVAFVLIVSVFTSDRDLYATIGSALGELLLAPFIAAFAVVLYYDLRARREGFGFDEA
jgi:hypothetical protein